MEKTTSPLPTVSGNKEIVKTTLSDDEKNNLTKEELILKLNNYEEQNKNKSSVRDVDEKLKLQQQEATRKENVLVMRLATKEQEMQELLTQIQELKQAQTPSTTQLQNMLIDPAVNLLFEKMKTELTETKDRLEQAQNDLSAWKFTPDSVSGKKLMAKCRMLIQENQDLGQQLSQGRIAQLEGELALQKKYSEELKGSQDEMNEFVIQLDEEVEGMQATICALQQELKQAKSEIGHLKEENKRLKEQQVHNHTQTPIDSVTPANGDVNDFHSHDNCQSSDLSHNHVNTECTNHELRSPNQQPMEIDSSMKDLQANEQISRTTKCDKELDSSNKHAKNQITVIRGTDESKKDADGQIHYLSPTKGLTKTSFSINDLLSTDSVKKDFDAPMEVTCEYHPDENGDTGLLNGKIDDAAV